MKSPSDQMYRPSRCCPVECPFSHSGGKRGVLPFRLSDRSDCNAGRTPTSPATRRGCQSIKPTPSVETLSSVWFRGCRVLTRRLRQHDHLISHKVLCTAGREHFVCNVSRQGPSGNQSPNSLSCRWSETHWLMLYVLKVKGQIKFRLSDTSIYTHNCYFFHKMLKSNMRVSKVCKMTTPASRSLQRTLYSIVVKLWMDMLVF